MDIRNLFTVKPASETSTKAASPEINQQEINQEAEPNTDVIDIENDGKTVSTKEATLPITSSADERLPVSPTSKPTKMANKDAFSPNEERDHFFIVESPQSSTPSLGTESDKPIEELVSPLRIEEKSRLTNCTAQSLGGNDYS